ncbi:hypothetical protein OQX61_03610, partial [Pedobacter sp. PLR]|uniref:hypothetical protein n=1 Tax=Pedobacter sp. PLR TaxID=2994465 RepID=UPI002245740C
YFLFFRLYTVCLLSYSFIIQIPNESLIKSTNDGYQLTIFQLEFYFFLIILYSFRPSRFSKNIIKSYTADGSKNFSKKTFFWIVYIGVLLAVFGIPLLILKHALGDIFSVITAANEHIFENTTLLIVAFMFLIISVLGLCRDFFNAFDHAKVQFFRFLLFFVLTIPAGAFIYLISVVLQVKADTLIVICLAFNLSLPKYYDILKG